MLRKGPSGSPCGDKEWEGPSQSRNHMQGPRGVNWGPEETMHSRDAAEVRMAKALESFAVCSTGAD